VPADITLAQFFDEYLMRAGRRCCIVSEDGKLLGLMTTHELRETPRDQWASTTVRQAMKPFDTMTWVEPNTDLGHVLEVMHGDDVNQVPVVDGGRLEGLIKREDLLRFVKTRAEFNY
jgi:CBS domain-containing protein